MSFLSDLELMELQIEALFTHDDLGRIVAVNEPDGGPAPRFFFGRSREGNRWRFRHDLPDETAKRLEALAAVEPVNHDLRALPAALDAMLDVLGTDRESGLDESGPAYRFPVVIPDPGIATLITRDNGHLLHRIAPYLEAIESGPDTYGPCAVVVDDGVAVAICHCARLTARAAEAGVETLPDYRGRGYAPAAVAAWAQAIRESGRIPLYSTSWDNLASQAVARKLGLVMYGSDLSV